MEAKIEEIPSIDGKRLVLVIENGFALGADKVFSITTIFRSSPVYWIWL